MRILCAKHKKLLNKMYQETNASSWEDLTLEQTKSLEKVGDFETLWSEVTRYLNDKMFENLNKNN